MKRFVFNPDLVLKPDKTRAIVFVRNEIESGLNFFIHFIHPRHAILLSLFNGNRDIETVLKIWGKLSGFDDISHAGEELRQFSKTWGNVPYLVPIEEVFKKKVYTYDPTELIVNNENIDLNSPRCNYPIDFLHVVTYDCEVSCIYCYSRPYINKRIELLPLERLDKILTEASHIGITNVALSGGDPLCHPKFIDLIKLYLSNNIVPSISTKVYISLDLAKTLKKLGIDSIQISIDALDEKINRKLIGRSGYLQEQLRCLENIQKAGLKLRTNTVLTSYNFENALKLIPYLINSFSSIVRIELSPYGHSIYHHHDKFFLSPKQYNILKETVREYKTQYPSIIINAGDMIDPNIYKRPFELKLSEYKSRASCSGGRWSFVLLPNGEVTICEELYHHPTFIMGDLRKQGILEMWNSPEMLSFLKPIKERTEGPCKNCSDFEECHYNKGRCIRRAIQAYGIENSHFPDPTCPYAPLGERV